MTLHNTKIHFGKNYACFFWKCRLPSSKLITKKVYRGHENWFHCLIMSNKIQRNLICLTTGSHSWNITHTLTHFLIGLYRHKKHYFFFIFPLSFCNKNSSMSRLTCLTVVVIKKMVQCTPDTWSIVKLRHGVTMIHQTASVRAEGERQRKGEPRVSAHPSLLLFFFGLYITLYVPNLFLLFTHKYKHRANFLCKSSLMWSEFN